ncbi:hypothetical protein PENTCL1PPCAC_1227 [Pristionchus entomophagus]|uniref:Uncharacterized protein n=1 Tax=Pristionchus entomophagus TaxID=358040 RepID=A0AAV5S9S8_9BILA|nr:hypothetical protein PENTCL1PPCAC_1227 [Pristionchus entomophagus]
MEKAIRDEPAILRSIYLRAHPSARPEALGTFCYTFPDSRPFIIALVYSVSRRQAGICQSSRMNFCSLHYARASKGIHQCIVLG